MTEDRFHLADPIPERTRLLELFRGDEEAMLRAKAAPFEKFARALHRISHAGDDPELKDDWEDAVRRNVQTVKDFQAIAREALGETA